jgi:NFU1 iron-sulfur cluster scaffold homolog, mitochondrial
MSEDLRLDPGPLDPGRLGTGIAIRAEPSLADPNTCKFTTDRVVHPGGPFFFECQARAKGSPLAEQLFAISGVATVLVAANVVSVSKAPDAAWSGLRSAIGAAIRAQLLAGVPAILETPSAQAPGARPDAELRAVVQGLLDSEVNRSISSHGGQISIVDIVDQVLFISMNGGCQGCAASSTTLRKGFEVMVGRIAPEIVRIVDTTDHDAGRRPFYRRPG